ncbi:MAG: phage minor head protein [Fibrobacteria bacterium]
MMPGKLDLGFAIGLEPQKAVDYMRAKGMDFSFDWYDVWQEAHVKAFTVAKAMQADVLQDIRTMVEKALSEGITLHEFRKDLTPKLMARGWWGRDVVDNPSGGVSEVQLGSPDRLETIYRTNTQTAYNAGRYRDQIENVDERPFWQYIAVMDTLTRPTHAVLNKKVFRADDPFWDSHYPPNGFNCRCRVRALTKDQVKARGLEVYTAEGHLSEKMVTVARGVQRPVTVFKGYGLNMAPDPGWSYNPGKVNWEPTIPKYAPEIGKALEKAEKSRGLAKEHPVKTYADFTPLMKAFHEENPGIFFRGFSEVETKYTDDYFAATDSRGKIILSTRTFPESDGLNPARDFKEALTKIRKGGELTFNEEYSVETVWHEVLHNRARGKMPLPQFSFEREIMETVNQLVARHTYPDFLSALGGLEAHGERILLEGYGYGRWVENFRAILKASGLKEPNVMDALTEVSFYRPWNEIPDAVAEVLAHEYGDVKWAKEFKKVLRLVGRKFADPVTVAEATRDILLNR